MENVLLYLANGIFFAVPIIQAYHIRMFVAASVCAAWCFFSPNISQY